jgi:hypothetical protein
VGAGRAVAAPEGQERHGGNLWTTRSVSVRVHIRKNFEEIVYWLPLKKIEYPYWIDEATD